MAAATSVIASSAFLSRVSCERQECVRGLLSVSSTAARENSLRPIGGRLNTPWRRVSVRKLAVAMASAASGVDTQQWPIPQTVEEAIEQVIDDLFRILSRLGHVEGRMNP